MASPAAAMKGMSSISGCPSRSSMPAIGRTAIGSINTRPNCCIPLNLSLSIDRDSIRRAGSSNGPPPCTYHGQAIVPGTERHQERGDEPRSWCLHGDAARLQLGVALGHELVDPVLPQDDFIVQDHEVDDLVIERIQGVLGSPDNRLLLLV